MQNNKKALLLTITGILTLLVFVVSAAFAYINMVESGGTGGDINTSTGTTDSLRFEIEKELSIKITQENFGEGKGNLSDKTFARATQMANNTTNEATSKYYLYLNLKVNDFKYTTDDKKTEVLLQIIDPDGNPLTVVEGLNYVTTDEGLSGFDITEARGLKTIVSEYTIHTDGEAPTTQEWGITILLVNLETNQKENYGKVIEGQVLMQAKEEVAPDIYIASTYNRTKGMPSTFGADATVSCNNDNTIYNRKYNRLEISNINGETNCTVSYSKNDNGKDYLNNKVTKMVGTVQGDGMVVEEEGIRFQGKNPNNYIWFNDELWRIIGVFDSEYHGNEGENLVKIKRAYAIEGIAFDKNNKNTWETSSLKSLLNGAYLNSEDGTNSGYCYRYSTTVTTTCDYREDGIGDAYRAMIADATWNIGGRSTDSATASTFLTAEKITKSSASKIGLMTVSDYGYSVLASDCSRSTNVGSYDTASCAGKSWMQASGGDRTITPNLPDSYHVFIASGSGYVSSSTANYGFGVTPVLYLEAGVYVIDGDGTKGDPYILAKE